MCFCAMIIRCCFFVCLSLLLFLLFLLHVLICVCRVSANRQEPQTYKTCKNLHTTAKTNKNTEMGIHTQQTPTQLSNTLAVPAEGNPACITSLWASGHVAKQGGWQRARPKAIEVRGPGIYFIVFSYGGWGNILFRCVCLPGSFFYVCCRCLLFSARFPHYFDDSWSTK